MKKNKSKRRQRIFALLACVCLFCSMFVVGSHAENTITDLTGTTWVFNNPIDVSSLGTTSFNLSSSLGSTFYVSHYTDNPGIGGTRYHSDLMFGNTKIGGSMTQSSATYPVSLSRSYSGEITITGGSSATSSTLISFFQSNATQIIPDPLEDIMSDSGDALTEILSELGDVAETIIDTPILLIMCIGLPVISFVVGLLARLKDRV